MYKSTSEPNKFNLYLLDEGEVYIKEYIAEVIENQNLRRKGILYLGSRSFVFESNEKSEPIEKFMFRYNTSNSIQDSSTANQYDIKPSLISIFKRKILVPSINTPYKNLDGLFTIEILLTYEVDKRPFELFLEVIEMYGKKQGFENDSLDVLDKFYKFNFDYTILKSISELCLLKQELRVNKIIPLIEIPGIIMATDKRVYFQPIYVVNCKKSYSIKYTSVVNMYRRRVKLMEVGLEIIYASSKGEQKTILLEFENNKIRESIFHLICNNLPDDVRDKCTSIVKLAEVTKKWVVGELSNYEYLIQLNSAANRTRNNMSQYPVFPWVLNNYSNFEIDLENSNNYRDLSRPIGKLTERRFNSFKERFIDMPEPKYLYGTHYSTPAYTIGYLLRMHPQYMIKLQAGRFDHPDRLFSSIEIDWDVCLTNPGSLKELIPEFYENDISFLKNTLNLNLNLKDSGVKP